MKKISVLSLCAIIATNAVAGENPMFARGAKNSVSLHIAQGTGSGSLLKLFNPFVWDISPMTMIMVQYAQPTEIMRLPARFSANIVQNTAYNSGRGLSFLAGGLSWDIAPLSYDGWYIGVGIGPYYRDNRDRWVSSRLFFGEKLFIGKNITENWRTEIFTIHFSNGDFTPINRGFNFAGIALNYSF